MNKRAISEISGLTIGVDGDGAFFVRGRDTSRRADRKAPVVASFRLTFEDPLDMARFLTPARVRLIEEVRRHEDSVSGLARRLRRDLSSVRRDVNALERAGLVVRDDAINPGHGRMVVIRSATHRPITFQSTL